MPNLQVQEYSAVPSGETASILNHHRDTRVVASFLVKFLSLLIVTLAIAFNVIVNLVLCSQDEIGDDNYEDKNDHNNTKMDIETCKPFISLRSLGTVAFILDLVSVPLMWVSAQSTRNSRVQHAWMKTVSWVLYLAFTICGCLIFFGGRTPSFFSFFAYFIVALASFCCMMLYVEYHHCRETPSRPDFMCLENEHRTGTLN